MEDYRPKLSRQQIREALREYFQEKAAFRRRKAEQYPNDIRNAASAEALDKAAAYCMTINDDDPLMSRITPLGYCFVKGGVFTEPCIDTAGNSGDSGQMAIRCGFDGPIDSAEFLAEWVTELESDYPKYVKALKELGGEEVEDEEDHGGDTETE